MPEAKSVWERCWCWQYGRCLVDCPTADLPRPRPFTEDAWRTAALAAMYSPVYREAREEEQ